MARTGKVPTALPGACGQGWEGSVGEDEKEPGWPRGVGESGGRVAQASCHGCSSGALAGQYSPPGSNQLTVLDGTAGLRAELRG